MNYFENQLPTIVSEDLIVIKSFFKDKINVGDEIYNFILLTPNPQNQWPYHFISTESVKKSELDKFPPKELKFVEMKGTYPLFERVEL